MVAGGAASARSGPGAAPTIPESVGCVQARMWAWLIGTGEPGLGGAGLLSQ